jgi:hypothetical protein
VQGRSKGRGPGFRSDHLTSTSAQFAIGNRDSKIANIAVPVVQRTEQGFPKGKTPFLLEFADDISSEQMTAFKRVE